MLKSCGVVVVVVVAWSNLVSAQGPLVLGLGLKGLGLRVWGLEFWDRGLTILDNKFFFNASHINLPFSHLTSSWSRRDRTSRCLEEGDPAAILQQCRRTQWSW